MLEQIITCPQCQKTLSCIGGESAVEEIGFNEHYFCEVCKVNIDVAVKFNTTGGDKST